MTIELNDQLESEFEQLAQQLFLRDLIQFLSTRVFAGKVPDQLNLTAHVEEAIGRAANFSITSCYGGACFVVMELAAQRLFENQTLGGDAKPIDETVMLIQLFNEGIQRNAKSWNPEAERKLLALLDDCHQRFSTRGLKSTWYRVSEPLDNFLSYLDDPRVEVLNDGAYVTQVYSARTSAFQAWSPPTKEAQLKTAWSALTQIWVPLLADLKSNVVVRLGSSVSASGAGSKSKAWVSNGSKVVELDETKPLIAHMQISALTFSIWPDVKAMSDLPAAFIMDPKAGFSDQAQSRDADKTAKSTVAICKAYDASQHLRRFQWKAWPAIESSSGKAKSSGSLEGRFTHAISGVQKQATEADVYGFCECIQSGLTAWFEQLSAMEAVTDSNWVCHSDWLKGELVLAYGLSPGSHLKTVPSFRFESYSDLLDSKIDLRWSGAIDYQGSTAVVHLDCIAATPFDFASEFGFFLDEVLDPTVLPSHTLTLELVASIEPVVQVGKPVLNLASKVAGSIDLTLEMWFDPVKQCIGPRFVAQASAVNLNLLFSDGLISDFNAQLLLCGPATVFDWKALES